MILHVIGHLPIRKVHHLANLGLAVLLERRELCWVDAGLQQLSCVGLNGLNRRVVYAPLQYPFGLTVHNEQRFYWTDWSEYAFLISTQFSFFTLLSSQKIKFNLIHFLLF